MKIINWLVLGCVLLMLVWAFFPLYLEGSDAVNQTANMSKYLGLSEINNLAPLLIFIGLTFSVCSLVWLRSTESGRRFIEDAKEFKDQYFQ